MYQKKFGLSRQILDELNVKHVRDLEKEPRALREKYGMHICGQSVLTARRPALRAHGGLRKPFGGPLFAGTPASRAIKSANPRNAASSTSSDRPKVRGCCRGGAPPQAFSGGGPMSTFGRGGGGGGV